MPLLSRFVAVAITAIVAGGAVGCKERGSALWPRIIAVEDECRFEKDRQEHRVTQIKSEEGRVLYVMDTRFNAWRHESDQYNYSGILDCRLYPLEEHGNKYSTLLQNTIGATRDWETSGRFVKAELFGLNGCGISRGVFQRCRLRGMAITIEISNVTATGNEINGLNYRVLAVNDADALAEIDVSEENKIK